MKNGQIDRVIDSYSDILRNFEILGVAQWWELIRQRPNEKSNKKKTKRNKNNNNKNNKNNNSSNS